MSQDIKTRQQFRGALAANERVCALFFATWCPFCRRFLSDFDEAARANSQNFACVRIDDHDELSDEYDINVYPSVVFFEKGKVLARLDGVLGRGLAGSQLTRLIDKCTARRTDR